MNNMNKFYSLKGNLPDNEHQLTDLGSQTISIILGSVRTNKYDWGGRSEPETKTYYRDITADDYDRAFVTRLTKVKPVYEIDGFLDYHYNNYLQNDGLKDLFLKHMKYVILPLLTKMKGYEACAELFTEWINNKSLNRN